ncbi:helix-turn-helix transcriptional regulator [Marinobacter sp. 1Y8]
MLLLTGFGLSCLCLLFIILYRDFRHLVIGQVFLLIVVTSTAFLLDPLVDPDFRWLTSDIQTALPGLFWLLCELTFARRPRLLSIWSGMAIYTFVAPAIARLFISPDADEGVGLFFGWTLGRLLEYVIMLRGFWHVVSHWRDDLVEARRRARLILLLIVGGAVGWAAVSLNMGLSGYYTNSVIVAIAAFSTAYFLLQGRQGVFAVAGTEARSPAETDADKMVIAQEDKPSNTADEKRLRDVMAKGYYSTERLTLAMLAAETGMPEYRLRSMINQTLGYRNFNDYINQLRIADAAVRLKSEPETPVLNISLDVGYRTLSSFNRAFREITGTTPTAYRQQPESGEAGVKRSDSAD